MDAIPVATSHLTSVSVVDTSIHEEFFAIQRYGFLHHESSQRRFTFEESFYLAALGYLVFRDLSMTQTFASFAAYDLFMYV